MAASQEDPVLLIPRPNLPCLFSVLRFHPFPGTLQRLTTGCRRFRLIWQLIHHMVVVGKHFTCLLSLVGNPHLTAKIQMFAPLPTSTKTKPEVSSEVLRITPELFEIHKQRALDARLAQDSGSACVFLFFCAGGWGVHFEMTIRHT